MSKILLDTHILLWILSNQKDKFTNAQKTALESTDTEKYVSHISLMEIAIKQKLGKLGVFDTIKMDAIIDKILINGLFILPFQDKHIGAYQSVPLHEQHRDPFDRFLIATALSENMTLMSSDEKFKLYEDIILLI